MLSIIIPTLNEQKHLPGLLESIKKQGFLDYQIIVADAGSKDGTREIAKHYGCIITEGGLPAKGRNNGAKVAKGDILFFLDSDTVLADGFLEKVMQEFNIRKLDVASFCLKPYPQNAWEYFLLNIGYNYPIRALEKILPHGAMGIIIKKTLFEKCNGYDESITLAEDHDLVRRAAKSGRFGIITSAELCMSTRRFKKDGWVATGIKFFLCELHMVFIGPVKSDIFNYKFDHYQDKDN